MEQIKELTGNQLIVTIGISGSGKSSWAAKMVQEAIDKYVVVNRDKIRELLFGYTEEGIKDYYFRDDLRKLEKQVNRYEDLLIKESLAQGKTPIIDATHLKREYLTRFKYWNVPVKLMWFDIELGGAIGRDANRTRRVGDEVITKQFRQYQSLKESLKKNPIDFTPVEIEVDYTLPPAFIFDIDGTLAHKGDRSPYDWMKVGLDSLDIPTRYMATSIDNTNEAFKNEGKVIICTGRDGVCLDETEKWLIAHKIPYDAIYIRPKGDMRPDWVVKEEMWREISKNYHIIGMFDDREQVVNRARALGFKVFQCEYHNF